MPTISVTRKITVNISAGWPEEIPITIYPPHYNLNDRVWLVYVRDLIGSYRVYIGEVVIAAVRQDKRLAGANGRAWRYAYNYMVTTPKGSSISGDSWDNWVFERQLFNTKEQAIENMRGATLFVLQQDRKRHSKYLAVTDATIQQVKDTTTELTYARIE